ncbi:MAG: SMI1/KNR4 family protein [Desulfobacterales bacterium]|nr:SMI1/KNR4 family protein [Desulfobacterales bacterium]
MRTFKFMRYGAFSDDTVSAEELKAWSAQFGFPLPDRYVAFMAQTNGGSIYPSVFEHQHPQIKPIAAFEDFYDWQSVLEESELDCPAQERSIAPDHLIIGSTTVEDQIVLRLHSEAPGAIYLRGHNTSPNWITDGVDEFGFIAHSFGAFIDSLREPKPGEPVYLKIWDTKGGAAPETSISSVVI